MFVMLKSYGITHGLVEISLDTNPYPKRIDLVCYGCNYISGEVLSGPYKWTVEEINEGNDIKYCLIGKNNNNSFILKCDSIHLLKHTKTLL